MNKLQLERRLRRLEETVGIKSNLRENYEVTSLSTLDWSSDRNPFRSGDEIPGTKGVSYSAEDNDGNEIFAQMGQLNNKSNYIVIGSDDVGERFVDDGSISSWQEALNKFKKYTGIKNPEVFYWDEDDGYHH